MSLALRTLIFIVAFGVFVIVFTSLIRRKLNESSSILWLVIGFFAMIFGIYPELLSIMGDSLGIEYKPGLLFMIAIAVLLLIVFRNNCHITVLELKVRELTMQLSLMKGESEKNGTNALETAQKEESD